MLFSGEEKHLDKVMDFKAYEEFIESQDGYGKFCVICGTPFKPGRKNQITCLSQECRKARQKQRVDAWYGKMSECELELQKEKHRTCNREYRRKKYNETISKKNSKKVREHWAKIEKFDKLIAEVGDHYGEYQMKKTLEMVEPIKLTLGDD